MRRRARFSSFLDISPRKAYYAARGGLVRMLEPAIGDDLVKRTADRIMRLKGFDRIGPSEALTADSWADEYDSRKEGAIQTGLYEIHQQVNACTAKVSRSLAQAPLNFYRASIGQDGAKELQEISDHPIARMFQWVNPFMDPFQFTEWIMSFLQLTGTCYIAKTERTDKTPKGVPYDLFPLFPAFVTKIKTPQDGIVGYRYTVKGEEALFTTDEVMYLKTFSPTERFSGMGIYQSAQAGVLTDLRAQKFNDNLLKNGVYISGTLESEDDSLDEDEASAIRDEFESKYASASNVARVAVLWGGMKFTPHSLAHKDIQFIEQRMMTREDIATIAGIPLEVMGYKAANFATLREKRRIFWEDTVMVWGMMIEYALNSTILPQMNGSEDIEAHFDYSGIPALRSAVKEMVEAGEIGIRSGQYTPDEWRREYLKLPTIGGASDIQFMSGGLRPLEHVAAEAAADINERSTSAQRSGTGDQHSERMAGVTSVHAPRLMAATCSASKATSKAQSLFMQHYDEAQIRFERRLNLKLREVARSMERKISDVLDSRTMLGEQELTQELRTIIVEQDGIAGRAATREVLEQSMVKWSSVIATEIGITDVFNLENKRAINFLKVSDDRMKNHYGKTYRGVKKELIDSIRAGEPIKRTEARLAGYFTEYRGQAATVARTETVPAMNFSATESILEAKAAGVNIRAIWRTRKDATVRGAGKKDQFDHLSMEGVEIDPEVESFQVSGETMDFPGDSSQGASAGNTINCRCTIEPRVLDRALYERSAWQHDTADHASGSFNEWAETATKEELLQIIKDEFF